MDDSLKIVIVESPKKAKTFNAYLGDSFKVMSSVGHIRDLPAKSMGLTKDLDPIYEVTNAPLVESLQRSCRNRFVYLATDLDREGEAIAQHLIDVLGLTPDRYARCGFTEITETAVKHAIANPLQLRPHLIKAQEARRVIDRIIGYEISPLSNQALGAKSAGRVQTAAVKVVVERQRLIDKFSKKPYFELVIKLEGDNGQSWTATMDSSVFAQSASFDGILTPIVRDSKSKVRHITSKALVSTIQSEVFRRGKVTTSSFSSSPKFTKAPSPLTTSLLAQASSVKLGLDTETTMKTAQSLYEQGKISYHRTDNPNLSDETIALVNEFIKKWQTESNKSRSYLLSTPNRYPIPEGAQEAHEAIRPTDLYYTGDNLPENEKLVYQLIRSRTIACQMAALEYEKTNATLSAGFFVGKSPKVPVNFKASGQVTTFGGWKEMATEDDTKNKEQPIPILNTGMELPVLQVEVESKTTRPPARFTEATFIAELERQGVVRPSTISSTIQTIKKRNYIHVEQRNIVPSKLAMNYISALESDFDFCQIQYTSGIEVLLDKIAHGNLDYSTLVHDINNKLQVEIGKFKEKYKKKLLDPECPKCKKNSLKRFRKKSDKSVFFWVCIEEQCDSFYPDLKGKPDLLYKPAVKSKFDCPKCSEPLILHPLKKGKSQRWWTCSSKSCETMLSSTNATWNIDNSIPDYSLWSSNHAHKCPTCNEDFLVLTQKQDKFRCPSKTCDTFLKAIKHPNGTRTPDYQLHSSAKKCPKCNTGILQLANSKKTYYCSKNDCKTFVPVSKKIGDLSPDIERWKKEKSNEVACPSCGKGHLILGSKKNVFFCSKRCGTFVDIIKGKDPILPDIETWKSKQKTQ